MEHDNTITTEHGILSASAFNVAESLVYEAKQKPLPEHIRRAWHLVDTLTPERSNEPVDPRTFAIARLLEEAISRAESLEKAATDSFVPADRMRQARSHGDELDPRASRDTFWGNAQRETLAALDAKERVGATEELRRAEANAKTNGKRSMSPRDRLIARSEARSLRGLVR